MGGFSKSCLAFSSFPSGLAGVTISAGGVFFRSVLVDLDLIFSRMVAMFLF